MFDDNDHAQHVHVWIERSARGLPPEQLLSLFERALHALWRRTNLTLGDVTLTAIVERVFQTASERFPMLAPLRVDAAGISCGEFHESTVAVRENELVQGMRFVLVEFLRVLGNLTAEILSSALHSELSKVTSDDAARGDGPPPAPPRPPIAGRRPAHEWPRHNRHRCFRRRCEEPDHADRRAAAEPARGPVRGVAPIAE